MKSINCNLKTGIMSTVADQYSADNEATKIVLDYTGTDVETWDKWLDLKMSGGSASVQFLGTLPIVEFVLTSAHTIVGSLSFQPYAKNGSQKYHFAIRAIKISESLDVTIDTSTLKDDIIDYFNNRLDVKSVITNTVENTVPASVEIISEIDGQSYVLNIPKGADGYTPIKGTDYFDGNDGYTPIKGTDYNDGEQGIQGLSAYQVWLALGNVGTESQFILSLKGDSGSPKGVYATLALLQSAFPTGTTGIYLVTADGKWYYWNSTAWTAGGTYQSTGIADGSIIQSKRGIGMISFNSGGSIAITATSVVISGVRYAKVAGDFNQLASTVTFNSYANDDYYICNGSAAGNTSMTVTKGTRTYYWQEFPYLLKDQFILMANNNGVWFSEHPVIQTQIAKWQASKVPNVISIMPVSTPITIAPGSGTDVVVTFPTGHLISDNVGKYMYNSGSAISVTVSNYQYLVLNWVSGIGSPLTSANFSTIANGSYVPDGNKIVLFYNSAGKLSSPIAGYNISSRLNLLNFKIVAKSGGDYTTINAALQAEPAGTTLLIMPGTYDECVRGFNKEINIIGVNRQDCILLRGTGEYANPPLEAGSGYVANMTIHADRSNTILTDDSTVDKAYAVHIETDFSSGKALEFNNCDLISDWSPAVGIGLRPNFNLKFKNCTLNGNYLTTYRTSSSTKECLGGLLFHDSATSLLGANQNIILDNCKVLCNGTNAMTAYSLSNLSNTVNATFYNTMLWSLINGKATGVIRHMTTPTGGAWEGNNTYLTLDSYGNNVTEINP